MVVNGSLSKTAVNGSAGARTQLSGLIVAVLTVLTLLLLTGLFEQLPLATLAAVVIAAVIELVDLPALRRLYRIYAGRHAGRLAVAQRPDFLGAIAALLGVLVFDTLPGLFIGIAVSLLLLLYRASSPHVAVLGRAPDGAGPFGDLRRHRGYEPPRDIAVLRIEGGLFFANADSVRARIHDEAEGRRAVVIDAETVPFVDVTAAEMIGSLAGELRARGVTLRIAGDVGRVRDVLRRAGEQEAADQLHPDVASAVAALEERHTR
jgi:sulfate permease, SulP family